MQESIEKILMTICQQNRKIILNAMVNEKTFSNLIDPLGDKNQYQVIDRGVSTSVFRCKERILFPKTTKHCCKNLPVMYFDNIEIKEGYFNAKNGKIVEECIPRKCSNTLAMMFKTINENYICQYENKITLCEQPRKFDPSIGINGRLRLFTKQDYEFSLNENFQEVKLLKNMIQQTKLNSLTQTLDEVLTEQNCQKENCNQMKTSIKRKFINILTLDNIDWLFFQTGFKLLILIMAFMFIIEKTISLIMILLDLIRTCFNDRIHETTCTGLLLTIMKIIVVTANPICIKNNNGKPNLQHEVNMMREEINMLKQEIKRMTSRRKRRNEDFRRRLGIIQENELFERQQPYSIEFEDETQTKVPLLAISQF